MIADPRIQGVSLTGSERAGGGGRDRGRNLKKVVLELGGSDPFLVLDPTTGPRGTPRLGRLGNAGQACNAAKRIIVMDAVYDGSWSVAAPRRPAPGDPAERETRSGRCPP